MYCDLQEAFDNPLADQVSKLQERHKEQQDAQVEVEKFHSAYQMMPPYNPYQSAPASVYPPEHLQETEAPFSGEEEGIWPSGTFSTQLLRDPSPLGSTLEQIEARQQKIEDDVSIEVGSIDNASLESVPEVAEKPEEEEWETYGTFRMKPKEHTHLLECKRCRKKMQEILFHLTEAPEEAEEVEEEKPEPKRKIFPKPTFPLFGPDFKTIVFSILVVLVILLVVHLGIRIGQAFKK